MMANHMTNVCVYQKSGTIPELYEVDLYPNWLNSYVLYSMLHRKEATQAMIKVYALCKLPSRSFTNIFAYDQSQVNRYWKVVYW